MSGSTTPADASVIVVGGGPGGMIAAETLAGHGVHVTLIEAMPSLGRKFLLAGRGGLNLTHSEDLDSLLGRYGVTDDRLRSAVRHFGPDQLRAWCAGLGVDTFVGSSGRVFPEGLRANTLLAAWTDRLDRLGVDIRCGVRWQGWSDAPGSSAGDVLVAEPGGHLGVRSADCVVLSLGGASWPRVGSDGAWVEPFAGAGVAVAPLRASNAGVDVAWSDHFSGRFAGEPVKNVIARCGDQVTRGELMVTEHGLEGGAIYALSRPVRDQVDRLARAEIHLDLHPDLDHGAVMSRLRRRRPKDSVTTVLRRQVRLGPVAVGLLREATGNVLPVDDEALARLIKDVPIRIDGVAPLERAISTAGGVEFSELDDRFMLRRRPGTFVVGEMLDWDAPTGGYLLQATFSTGVAGALGVLDHLADR